MATKNMLELLKTQFKDKECHIEGTHISESGLTVSVKRLPGEIILFFHTDSNLARERLKMPKEEQQSCDCLVFYTLEQNRSNCEVICFLELKGSDFDYAVNQICNTYKHVHLLSRSELQPAQLELVIPAACICTHNKEPTKAETRGRERLKRIFGANVRIKHGDKHYQELGDELLRKLHSKCASQK